MNKLLFVALAIVLSAAINAAQTLNNPIGSDGCYVVKWDCSTNRFADSNSFEANETFTFAIDITGTSWVGWLAENEHRGICTNFSLTSDGAQNIARDGDRLFHITGNIYGKTINIAQLASSWVTPALGSRTAIYSNIFGFCTDPEGWWINPGDNVIGNSDCFFRTAAYTGTHTCPVFFTNDYAGNIYTWINQKGYAAPCVIAEPCYSTTPTPDPGPDPEPTPEPIVEGSHVYTFATDAQQRGYYNRPYERYEAEPDHCETNGTFLAASDDQADLQSEASHQQAVQLINVNSYVQWKVNKAGDGLTVRFSLPDNAAGTGTTGNIDIYAGNDKVGSLTLNSYWAWQYTVNGGSYPTNTPATPGGGNVVRMRFDEMHVRLSRPVASGEYLKIVKTDNNTTPYTIDFTELEPVPEQVTFESLSGNKIRYDGVTDMQDFITANPGKIIYFPEGRWVSHRRLYLTNGDNTQLIGAGMWYTEIYFDAASNNQTTYSYRGIEGSSNNLRIEGLYLNTVNNQRYYNGNSSYQVGKGFQNCFGSNSVIRNCWVEHFECGVWVSDYSSKGSNNLLIEHCRFRNNYADGVNCSHGSNGHTVRYCSFRNNGDDDMASWSSGKLCSNVTFAYCTAENNWRASSLGFFGGKGHTAHHLFIADALESGARVNSDFSGNGFSQQGAFNLYDITIRHSGCINGTRGNKGDFWGNMQGALNIGSTANYAIYNIHFNNIEINDARCHAVFIRAVNGKPLSNISLKNLTVNTAAYNGIYFAASNGTMTYCNLVFNNVQREMNNVPSALSWTQDADCQPPTPSGQGITTDDLDKPTDVHKFFRDGRLYISVNGWVYDAMGRMMIDNR